MVVSVKFATSGGRIQSNLPAKDNKPVAEAVRRLYVRIVEGEDKDSSKKRNKAGKWKDFATTLRKSLDQSFGAHWHVLVTPCCGFHCKFKQMARLTINGCKDSKSGDSLIVIIWKSPGVEPVESSQTSPKPLESSSDRKKEDVGSDSKAEDAGSGSNGSKAEEPCNNGTSSRFHLLQPSENDIEAGSEMETSVQVLRDILQSDYPEDTIELAKHVRSCLTDKLGTIWHVIVGDFVLDHAEDCELSITASYSKDSKITCFRHAQTNPRLIDWKRLASSIPYAVIVLVCFAYMAFHSVCKRDTANNAEISEPYRSKGFFAQTIENNICTKPDWDFELGVAAVITVVSSFVAKRFLRNS